MKRNMLNTFHGSPFLYKWKGIFVMDDGHLVLKSDHVKNANCKFQRD